MIRLSLVISGLLFFAASSIWASVPRSNVDYRISYRQLYDSYQNNDSVTFLRQYQSYMKSFGQTEYADDAMYLAAMRELNRKNYSSALKLIQTLETRYARSNRLPSAKLAKGSLYRKLNLPDIARSTYSSLAREFPGSPEATRAQVELKTMGTRR